MCARTCKARRLKLTVCTDDVRFARVSREIYHSASQATNGKARNKFTRLTFTDTRRSIRGALRRQSIPEASKRRAEIRAAMNYNKRTKLPIELPKLSRVFAKYIRKISSFD